MTSLVRFAVVLLNHRNMAYAMPFCITYTGAMEKPKNPGGRPPIPDEDKLVQRSIRLKQKHWDKIDALGLDWLRKLIERAKPPK